MKKGASKTTATPAEISRDQDSVGRMLESCRNYLTIVARAEMAQSFQRRIDASDIVQETFLEAYRDFSRFRGKTSEELLAWLRNALLRNILDEVKRQRAACRDVRREMNDANAGGTGAGLLDQLCADMSTPSHQVVRAEQKLALANAISDLPPDHRDVIVFRNICRWPFQKIGNELGKSEGAARMLWLRALDGLRRAMDQ